MEFLINDLKKKLLLRKKAELERIEQYKSLAGKEPLFISAGKVYELDFLIGCIDEMLQYNNETQKIKQ